MVTKKSNYITALVVSIILTSCFESNEIHFDVNEKSVKSCNQKGLRQLYIKNDSTADIFYFLYCDSNHNDFPKVIYFDSISEEYCIYKGWNNRKINNTSFKLMPLSQYTIERVQGDASAYKIKVWTDKNGRVNKTSKENCNN